MTGSGRGGGPREAAYDTVIVGGAVMGSSLAYWLSENPDYDGTVLVVEIDSTYQLEIGRAHVLTPVTG